MKRPVIAVGIVGLLVALTSSQAQVPTPKEDPVHDELRALKNSVLDAYNKGDFDRLASYLDEDVVITWQNADVSKKPAGVKQYFDKMLKGPNAPVKAVSIKPEVEELTHLYGNTGVAYGDSDDHYTLNDGSDFNQKTRWTATAVKKDGTWKVASVHISTNMFDNPVLDIAVKRTMWMAGGAGVVVGLLAGFLAARLLGRRPAA